MAAAIMTTKTIANLPSNKFVAGAGNHESATLKPPSPTRTPAIGVRNPIRSEAPYAITSKLTTHVPKLGLASSTR